MKQPPASPPHEKTLFPPARTALRDLYRAARHLPSTDPYAPARLARIADQTEYFLQEWPPADWPEALHSGQPLPARTVLLTWVQTARLEINRTGTAPGTVWPHARWQQISTTLLAALVPFA